MEDESHQGPLKPKWLSWFRVINAARLLLLGSSALTLSSCQEEPTQPSTLPNSVYVWQQHWTPRLSETLRGLHEFPVPIHQLLVLGAHIRWQNTFPTVFQPALDWEALRESGKPIGVGIRIEPFHHALTPETLQRLCDLIWNLLSEARQHGVLCEEVQIDYDSPQNGLANYRHWLRVLRDAARPARFTITALPAWLGEREFPKLIEEVDRFVLQVHSVQTRAPGESPALFEPTRAQRWIQKASSYGRPFCVSFPTYSGLVGYSPEGRQLGMALDGDQPTWPPQTRVLEFRSDPYAIASLSAGLRKKCPAHLEGFAWYRLPSGENERNWRWPTMAAVLEGRQPVSKLRAAAEGNALVDLTLRNEGEVDEAFKGSVVLRWKEGELADSEGLPGWSVQTSKNEARWVQDNNHVLRLSPGAQCVIGWARFHEKLPVSVEVDRLPDTRHPPVASP